MRWAIVMTVMAIIFGMLTSNGRGQEIGRSMPPGVTYKDGTYYVKRHVLKKFKRSEIRTYRGFAEEYKIKYKIVR